MRKRVGDTLIEVTLAVGIFSMIAIAIVAVMSGGTSSAQTALETTLARSEIDSQAEALRFIQSAYISDKDNANQRFVELWNSITADAIVLPGTSSDPESVEEVLRYSPENCSDLYNSNLSGNIYSQNAFIINTRNLGTFTSDTIGSVFISSKNNPKGFSQASTYPRIVYSATSGDDTETLINESSEKFETAEGIYVVAVKDAETTNILSAGKKVSAFYDFYIRSCWYGSNANQPSTISTVIRLYDPGVVDMTKK